jgi:hypothetical protein
LTSAYGSPPQLGVLRTLSLTAILVVGGCGKATSLARDDGSCAIAQTQANDTALEQASSEHFADARIVESIQVSGAESESKYGMLETPGENCIWVVIMSGYRDHTDWPPGLPATPTPSVSTRYIEMRVAVSAKSGSVVDWVLLTDGLPTEITGPTDIPDSAPVIAPAIPLPTGALPTRGPFTATPPPPPPAPAGTAAPGG